MVLRTLTSSAAILIGLAVVGALAGPTWDPVPVTDHLQPTASSTQIGGLEAGHAAGRVHPPGTFQVRETEVHIQLDGSEVGGLLREPVGAGSDLPGLVFVHGAGTGKSSEAFVEQGQQIASAGVVTAVPLLLFNSAARRLPLSVIGLLQYVTPVLQFVIGVTVAGEHMPVARWVGFGLVWVALVVLTVDGVRNGRRVPRAVEAAVGA